MYLLLILFGHLRIHKLKAITTLYLHTYVGQKIEIAQNEEDVKYVLSRFNIIADDSQFVFKCPNKNN